LDLETRRFEGWHTRCWMGVELSCPGAATLMVEYRTSKLVAAFAGVACLAFGGLAQAQTSNAGAVALVRANNQSVVATYATARDASGAAVASDGAIDAGEDQSGFSNAGAGGVSDTLSGVGATGGASTFGGGLNVVTQVGQPGGTQNNQINTGGGGATASPNGGVFNVDQSIQHK
jgi:hypothetical protein